MNPFLSRYGAIAVYTKRTWRFETYTFKDEVSAPAACLSSGPTRLLLDQLRWLCALCAVFQRLCHSWRRLWKASKDTWAQPLLAIRLTLAIEHSENLP